MALDKVAGIWLLIIGLCSLLLAACSTRPVVKVGLVAPFEGRYRPIGYDAIYAARLAVREKNVAGGVGGRRVELVAYDDGGDPDQAVERARQLAIDGQVVAAIGHFRIETSQAAWPIYAREGLPLIAPAIPAGALPADPCQGCSFPAAFRIAPATGLDEVFAGAGVTGTLFATGAPWPADVPDLDGAADFVQRYRAISGGATPGPYAWSTFQAMQLLFDALENGAGTRRQVGAALARRFWPDAPVYVYRLQGARQPVLIK